MRIIGLTGSIAMGKSTTARMLTQMGIPVHDADATVHRLYARGGAAVPLIANLAPQAVVKGAVDRQALSAAILKDPALLKALEAQIHPLVRRGTAKFLADQQRTGRKMVALDIPLLFETKGENRVDTIFVVSAHRLIQHQRALARKTMTKEKLKAIQKKQLPDAQKRQRAHAVIPSGAGRAFALKHLKRALRRAKSRPAKAFKRHHIW